MGLLDEKAILITGAASGIGRATAAAASAEGARLLLADVNDEQGEAVAAEIGEGASYVHCDVTDEASVQAVVAATVSTLGRIDGAFNCAGILGSLGNVGELELDGWKRIIDVDLNGVFLCTKHELGAMVAQGGGAILNMASAAGLVGWPGAAGYVAAKHGVVGLTKVTALEGAESGVTCNAICPGYVWTPLVEKQIEDQAKSHGISREKVIHDVLLAQQPNKKFATVEELGALCLFLSTEAGASITGAALPVDGGWTAH